MSVQRIQDLAAAAALTGTELVELEQSGGSVQCTTQDIADLASPVTRDTVSALASFASVASQVVPLSKVVIVNKSTSPEPVETTPGVPPAHLNDAGQPSRLR